MQTLAYKGVCPERSYPSNQHNCKREFPVNGQRLLRQALPYRLTEYERCDNLQAILQVLAQRQPVAFSMIIYTDFFAARKGLVPQKRQGQRIGGHSMVAVNYDLSRELVQVVQSWGRAESGPTDRGSMYIPFSWFTLQDEKTARELLLEAFALQA